MRAVGLRDPKGWWVTCVSSLRIYCPGGMAAFVRRIISTTKAPGAIGPYSQAVVVDRTMYISGQLGMDPTTGQLVNGGATQETKQTSVHEVTWLKLMAACPDITSPVQNGDDWALINMGEILKAANCDYNNVVKTTVLLADINDFSCVNEVYMQYFKTNFPARAAYQVAALPRGGRVEIEAVAVLGPIMDGPFDQKL
ncbi:2-iminobutanoate/2-iminopropanoate deaminase isoform X1 [Heptranchias perlo]|uniref:2-iminobutanoate/2-iminopropanoate deaminase isoform X1 n=1 Tax=Heptranchias perlo TaxID=212740 RepID=UPI00355A08D0